MSEIETDYTDSPVCPYCGAVFEDAWEWFLDEAESFINECDCGKSLQCDREVYVTYSTYKVPPCEDAP